MSAGKPPFSDDQILRQHEAIRDAVNLVQPYVSHKADVTELLWEFREHHVYSQKAQSLVADFHFTRMRRVRGDGNCFFRAFGFALFEHLIRAPEERLQRMIERVQGSHAVLEKYYSAFVFEDYLELFVDELKAVRQRSEAQLFDLFQDFSNAEGIVLLLRFLTSAELRTHPDNFIHFLPEPYVDIEAYCSAEVETMGRESEELHIVALATILEVNLRVAHLDQSDTQNHINFHDYKYAPDTAEPFFTILYRPGHYDLIYAA